MQSLKFTRVSFITNLSKNHINEIDVRTSPALTRL